MRHNIDPSSRTACTGRGTGEGLCADGLCPGQAHYSRWADHPCRKHFSGGTATSAATVLFKHFSDKQVHCINHQCGALLQALTPLDTQSRFPHSLLLLIPRQQKTSHLSGGGTGLAVMMIPLTAPHRCACTAAPRSLQMLFPKCVAVKTLYEYCRCTV